MNATKQDDTGLDDEIHILIPMRCRGEDCTKLYCPGGFDRPFTARKVIASMANVGWVWVEGEKPTLGRPFCGKCAP